ncbi:rRNA (guanine-N1-)-methyltransferase [Amycolatopsis mediterranei S699]|uniref:rRNA (Guanine-N1-)-methyltransferase n=2 Tax=Amycolatopsis mediterranei TaxID=33910 RepID=A0A0H3CZJ1_AMYMU|nr:rRNA (guanine-N1)-methyltransferase [Amycolatopsis mediterranei]AGT82589.1 rRNA (guanine-N1-)-methyltransferase [Amycolatopsis mediterranei RB]ADJ43748.1 rRNA (guanine-N1-)-methyltransferase [Amycolatopsis mediterranei U32]AEK40458.1 rRNA (guanine-N1-)-methyltransferase [Amycolatopsis mediterranei S699]AFO75460.1 rRNA (guanine-N1-)-methyltransferase [Amycolatopsis mediterranei S699]KDO08398.1 rRNA (guanine-N1)-methyltransferase [Amycolatopsis mediterranei]
MNLLHARIPAGTADTAPMVAARADFLASGAYEPLADELARVCADAGGLVIDAGAGTGYYLARVLEASEAFGLALDVSAVALRRAARAHPRLGAAVWNLWEPWPVGDRVASVVLNVFAPRNGPEFHRVLRPGGLLVVAAPAPDHLRELGDLVLAVDERKDERLDATLGEYFTRTDRTEVRREVALTPRQVRQAVEMGPAAFHLDRDGRRERLDALHEPQTVTVSFTVSTYRRR